MNQIAAIAAMCLTAVTVRGWSTTPKITAQFENATPWPIVVYLSEKPGEYYDIFPLGVGGSSPAVLRNDTTATVVKIPSPKRFYVSIVPEGKHVADKKIRLPAPSQRRPGDRPKLHCRIVRGDIIVTFHAGEQ